MVTVNTVASVQAPYLYHTNAKKILRTSDGTIHIVIGRTGYITHYHSHDNGSNWTAEDVVSNYLYVSIAKDSGDNLWIVYNDSGGVNPCYVRKATVTKGSPWTWSWGSAITVTGFIGYYPSICIDSHDYIHLICEGENIYAHWARSLNGGSSWTLTDINVGIQFCMCDINVDSNNNLFVIGARTGADNYIKGVKITYTADPEGWSVGSAVSLTSTNCYPPCFRILKDNRIVFITAIASDKSIYFRRSTNASDISSWDTFTDTGVDVDVGYELTLMIINNFIYRVYYSDATNGNIRVIETINYGSPWSSSTLIDDDATALITPQTSCSGERDVIYKDSESTPTIFHIADTFNFVRTQTDYLGLKDSVSKVVSRYRTILENLAFKDIIVKSKVISRLITEYLGIVGKTLLYHNYILNKYHRQKYPKQQIIINPEEYTMVWSDGFETGNFINWTYTNAMTIVTDPVYEGTYAAEFDGGYENAAYVEKVISSPQDHLYVEFWANFEGLAGGSEWRRVLEIYQDEDWLGNVRIQKKTDGWVLGLYDYWWNWHEGTTRLTTGWHKIKVYMTKGTGRAKIWLDDNLEVDTEVIHPDVQLTGFVIYVFDKYISEYYPRFTLDYVKCGI